MKLFLVQHGEAVPKDMDPDRPLSDKGRADIGQLGHVLRAADAVPARVIHSGKTRAGQTAQALAALAAPDVAIEASSGLDPKDPADAASAVLAAEDRDTMVVSHMPFVARLASLLLTGKETRLTLAFEPGSCACLEREGGGWVLRWFLPTPLLEATSRPL
ncbi:MAG: phosphohistidine phosphatase SixA [Rhodospirillaceae bacterium]|nr:phosphohistidine phosphatase SixA [Rhodospirillaceae bacterium]